jgi:hypothetical protein
MIVTVGSYFLLLIYLPLAFRYKFWKKAAQIKKIVHSGHFCPSYFLAVLYFPVIQQNMFLPEKHC